MKLRYMHPGLIFVTIFVLIVMAIPFARAQLGRPSIPPGATFQVWHNG